MRPLRAATPAKRCRLVQTPGRPEPCVEAGCPFWEPGGAALEGRCAFETIDFERRAELATTLLELRERIARAQGGGDKREARNLAFRLVGDRADD